MLIDIHTHNQQGESILHILNHSYTTKDIPTQKFSASIHPWHIDKNTISEIEFFYELLSNDNCIAIGEVGLDKNQLTHWVQQIVVFEEILKMNQVFNKPLIIHCVKAFNELFEVLKKYKNNAPVIIHGFSKNLNILNEVLKKGYYVSMGAAIFKEPFYKVVQQIPLNRLFLETDDSIYSIEQMYQQICTILQLDMNTLEEQLFKNYKAIFYK